MAFDLSTAKPVSSGFDLSTAKPVDHNKPESSYGEAALTMLSGAISEPVAGLAGLGVSLIPGLESGSGAGVVERVRENLTYQPRSEEGRQGLQDIAESASVITEPLGRLEKYLGDTGNDLAGPIGGAIGTAIPTALGELAGVGLAKGGIKSVSNIKQTMPDDVNFKDVAKGVASYQGPEKQRIARLIQSGSSDVDTAKYNLIGDSNPKTGSSGADPALIKGPESPAKQRIKAFLNTEGPKVAKDPYAMETIKQGFDQGVIAAVKVAGKTDKEKMLKMVDVMERGKQNKLYAQKERPSDIAGDTLMQRYKMIRIANKKAGSELDGVANSLKGQQVDYSPAIDSFIGDLENMGIKFGDDLTPNFMGSDIEGVIPSERVINQIVNRLKMTKTPDGHDVHRMKKFIDEQVTFGKNAEGLAGKTESILKGLRHNLDGVLDQQFPAYDKVNTTYAETIGALDALQDVAGKKMNLTGANSEKAVGTLLRRVMSNAQSRVRLIDSIDQIDGVVKNLGVKINDDLMSQILFVDELDSVFGPVARTSFQGQIGQAIESGVNAAATPNGAFDAATKLVGKAAEKARRINEPAAFKSIRDLLNQN